MATCDFFSLERYEMPCIVRMEHVGETIQYIDQYKTQWVLILEYIINMNNVGMNKNDISSYLYSHLKEDVLCAQLLFVHSFYLRFFYRRL